MTAAIANRTRATGSRKRRTRTKHAVTNKTASTARIGADCLAAANQSKRSRVTSTSFSALSRFTVYVSRSPTCRFIAASGLHPVGHRLTLDISDPITLAETVLVWIQHGVEDEPVTPLRLWEEVAGKPGVVRRREAARQEGRHPVQATSSTVIRIVATSRTAVGTSRAALSTSPREAA